MARTILLTYHFVSIYVHICMYHEQPLPTPPSMRFPRAPSRPSSPTSPSSPRSSPTTSWAATSTAPPWQPDPSKLSTVRRSRFPPLTAASWSTTPTSSQPISLRATASSTSSMRSSSPLRTMPPSPLPRLPIPRRELPALRPPAS